MSAQFGAWFAAVDSAGERHSIFKSAIRGAVVALAVGCERLHARDDAHGRRRSGGSRCASRRRRLPLDDRALHFVAPVDARALARAQRQRHPKTSAGAAMSIRFDVAHAPIIALLLTAGISLSGCASFSPDSGMSVVSDVAGQTIGKEVAFVRSADDAERAGGTVRRLLGRTLSVDAAVQIALLSNKGLQAAYNELALAETDLVQQSLPPNPTFSISRISGNGAAKSNGRSSATFLRSRHFRSAPRSRANGFARRSCARRSRRCGSPPTSGALISAASRPTRWSSCSPTRNRPRKARRSSPKSSARPARSTSSIRRANRCFMPKPPPTSPARARKRPARASA